MVKNFGASVDFPENIIMNSEHTAMHVDKKGKVRSNGLIWLPYANHADNQNN